MLSLLSLFERISRVSAKARVCGGDFESDEEEKNDSEIFFSNLFGQGTNRSPQTHRFRFFFSLSFSRSRSLRSSSSRTTTPRREVFISSKRTLFISRFAICVYLLSVLSLCSEYFLFFFLRKDGRFFLSTFDEIFQPLFDDFFYSKSAKCLLPHFNLRKNSRAEERTNERQAFANARSQKKGEENVIYILSDSNLD